MSKVWFITGTSTGFGRELAELLAERGERVVATARKPEVLAEFAAKYPDTVKAVRLDVNDHDSIVTAVKTANEAFGQIDVLVNNAGFGIFGGIEEITLDQFREQYETNVFGVVAVSQAVLPQMRERKSGHILNVSSVAGLIAFPGMSAYASSKFALEGISEAMAGELAPLGIHVILIEPGAFNTPILSKGIVTGSNKIADYEATVGATLAWFNNMVEHGGAPGDPKKAAAAMIQVVEAETPPLRLALGQDAVGGIEMKLKSVQTDLDAWREISMNAHYPDAVYGTLGG